MTVDPDDTRGTIWVASLLAWRTDSLEASRVWLEEQARLLEEIGDVERVRVVTTEAPPRAGVVLYFGTGEAYERYCHEHREEVRRAIERSSWPAGRPVQQVVERTAPRPADPPDFGGRSPS